MAIDPRQLRAPSGLLLVSFCDWLPFGVMPKGGTNCVQDTFVYGGTSGLVGDSPCFKAFVVGS